jgi:hypothetical protein
MSGGWTAALAEAGLVRFHRSPPTSGDPMALSFYDVSVATYLQILGAASGFLAKGREHCEKSGIDLHEVVETRLHPDMLPFRFQLASVAQHSLGAIRAIESGVFGPPQTKPDQDYAALEQLVADARKGLEAYDRATIDALEDRDVLFKLGDFTMPFVARDFVLSFSFPNFFFHATTAYDILRMKGVPIGKRDFMGIPRIKGR